MGKFASPVKPLIPKRTDTLADWARVILGSGSQVVIEDKEEGTSHCVHRSYGKLVCGYCNRWLNNRAEVRNDCVRAREQCVYQATPGTHGKCTVVAQG